MQDNLRYVCIYKNQDTLRYTVFHEIFEIGIYIQKSWHFGLRDIFIYKKPDTSQKARQFVLRFYLYKNPDIFCYAIFYGIFEIGGGGKTFLYARTMHFALHFYMQKKYTLRYVLISKIYRIVLWRLSKFRGVDPHQHTLSNLSSSFPCTGNLMLYIILKGHNITVLNHV